MAAKRSSSILAVGNREAATTNKGPTRDIAALCLSSWQRNSQMLALLSTSVRCSQNSSELSADSKMCIIFLHFARHYIILHYLLCSYHCLWFQASFHFIWEIAHRARLLFKQRSNKNGNHLCCCYAVGMCLCRVPTSKVALHCIISCSGQHCRTRTAKDSLQQRSAVH